MKEKEKGKVVPFRCRTICFVQMPRYFSTSPECEISNVMQLWYIHKTLMNIYRGNHFSFEEPFLHLSVKSNVDPSIFHSWKLKVNGS